MNILHINKYHHFKGGADIVYLKTARLMEVHGHNSLFFSMHHTDNLPCKTSKYFVPHVDLAAKHSFINQIGIAGRILYYSKARKYLSRLLDKHSVDIAHLHNIYHHISPSILFELRKRNIPVVMTIHDLKMVCASYLMYVDGATCEACSGNKYYMGIKKRCVKNSFSKSLLASFEMYLHHTILDVYEKVDVFIAPSNFHKKMMLDAGFRKEIVWSPNFFDDRELRETVLDINGETHEREISFVYFGRLSNEKGLRTLLNAAKELSSRNANVDIKIIGEGPLENELKETVIKGKIDNVRFLGYLQHKELYAEVTKSMAVILPSKCYENNPLSVLEAFALGKPVIGSRLGGIPELVEDSVTGITFTAGDAVDLCEKIEFIRDNAALSEKMGENARNFIEHELNAEKHYLKLMDIYKRAIERRSRNG